jgi:hypothetical protein
MYLPLKPHTKAFLGREKLQSAIAHLAPCFTHFLHNVSASPCTGGSEILHHAVQTTLHLVQTSPSLLGDVRIRS